MNRISLITLRYLCGAFLLTSSLQVVANEETSVSLEQTDTAVKADEHIIAGTRKLSYAQQNEIQELRVKEAQDAIAAGEALPKACAEKNEIDNDALKAALETKEGRAASSRNDSVKAGVFITTHQGVYYNPLSVSLFGDSVTLSDGSIWAVSSEDSYKTLNWLTSDLLIITPNQEFWPSYSYVITNQNTGIAVRVNMVLGPLANAVYRHWIVAIDYYMDRVWLEDGSTWSMTDYSAMRQWQPGDTVMIGVNDGWFSSSYPNILINVNMLNHCRGVCIY